MPTSGERPRPSASDDDDGDDDDDDHCDDDDGDNDDDDEEEEEEEEEEEDDDDDDEPPVASSSRLGEHLDDRPNAFFCVSLHSPSVLRAVADAQAAIVAADPRLGAVATSTTGAPALTPLSALHVTLGTARIQTSCERSAAAEVAEEAAAALQRLVPPGDALRLRGIQAFRDRVLYGAVVCEGLEQVARGPPRRHPCHQHRRQHRQKPSLPLPPAPATVLYAAIRWRR